MAQGNAASYDTIAAAGEHAAILHWTPNDGAVRPGELVLVDAGVEIDSHPSGHLGTPPGRSGRRVPSVAALARR